MASAKLQDFLPLDLELCRPDSALLFTRSLEKAFVQLDGLVEIKTRIVERQLNPRLEGRIDASDSVGCQE